MVGLYGQSLVRTLHPKQISERLETAMNGLPRNSFKRGIDGSNSSSARWISPPNLLLSFLSHPVAS